MSNKLGSAWNSKEEVIDSMIEERREMILVVEEELELAKRAGRECFIIEAEEEIKEIKSQIEYLNAKKIKMSKK